MNYNHLQYRQEAGLLRTEDERQMGMFLHLSALLNLIIPFAGYIVPVVLWQTNKNEMPGLEAHGKEAVNWMITSFIYSICGIVLIVLGVITLIAELPVLGVLILVVSILAMLTLSILNIVYAVVAGVKAGSGEHWEYPLNIKFLK
jgi:uncharacterized protein